MAVDSKTVQRDNECFMLKDVRKPSKKHESTNLSAITVGLVHTTATPQTSETKTARILLDSGSSGCIINKKYVKRLKTHKNAPAKWATKAGSFVTKRKAFVSFILNEFHQEKTITWEMHVDETSSQSSNYDMILGRDLLTTIGVDILFSSQEIIWEGASIPMRDPEMFKKYNQNWLEHTTFALEAVDEDFIQRMAEEKYSPADLPKEVEQCDNLTQREKSQLLKLLEKFKSLFDGSLGTWKTSPVELELKEGAKPYYGKPYPVPKSQEKKLKEEIKRLEKYGVLRRVNHSEWGMPSFTIPKKDGITLRSIADLRELNKRIKRKPFPIPKIQELLLKLENFTYGTSLDLNMGYYHILLTPGSARMCTVVFPWGKYEYTRLPMGLCNSPDIFQEKIGELMHDLEFTRAYIDDLLIVSTGSFQDHLRKMEQVFARLQKAGLKVNASKSSFCSEELEYLGYWISRRGIRPLNKKVEAINNLATPRTKKQLRSFIGMVNHYRDMWIRRSDVLAPLTELTSKKVNFKWTDRHQKAFDTMKKIMARETILAFPNFNKPFHIYTDASKVQLGAVITQDEKPIAFYSRKLSSAQTRYTTTEKELLSIVEVCKEFRTILLGQQLVIHTDHENLTYKHFNTDRVMRWRLFLEEYSPEIKWLKGQSNVVADALSRLDLDNSPMEESHVTEELQSHLYCYNAEEQNSITFPLDFTLIEKHQQRDKSLVKALLADKFHLKPFYRGESQYDLICHNSKIVVPQTLQKQITEWYHTFLIHPGINRTEETISQHFWWKTMRQDITKHVSCCAICQKNKRKHKKFGHVPPKKAEAKPWERLCVDLIGPYTISRKNNTTLICKCVTMIDPATGWFEIQEYDDKRAITIANIVEQQWLTRYPWPSMITYDQGPEFVGQDFKNMVRDDYGIKAKPITTRNPQANAIIERVHQTLGNIIRTFELQENYLDEDDPWAGILSAAAFAVRSTYHTTLQKTPGQLVYGRDMILNVQHIANWEYIKNRKQTIINKNNKRENAKRIPYQYQEGDQILLRKGTEFKYEQPYSGPHEILRVNKNGTVQIQKGAVTETVNIRRITPFNDAASFDQRGGCNMRQSRKKRKLS